MATRVCALPSPPTGRGQAYPHLPLAGAQVEVEAALKALVDEAREGGHSAQAVVALGHEAQLALLGLLLLPGEFLQGVAGKEMREGRNPVPGKRP